MKKAPIVLTLAILLLSFNGCRNTADNSYRFYYLRTQDTIAFGQSDACMAPVVREISGHTSDLAYLLQLYFDGPSEEGFYTPFPRGIRIIRASQEGSLLVLEVTAQFTNLENIRMTLAGACLTATCHELTGAESVQIICPEESYLFHRSDYTFLDVIDTQSGKDSQ